MTETLISRLTRGRDRIRQIQNGLETFWTYFESRKTEIEKAFDSCEDGLSFWEFAWMSYSSIEKVNMYFIDSKENQEIYKSLFFESHDEVIEEESE